MNAPAPPAIAAPVTAPADLARLFARIEAMTEELVALTADLVRIPTVNPPGENYDAIVAFLDRRLKSQGFVTEILRAEGAVADCDAYPRLNLVGRLEGARPGATVHFNGHYDVVAVGHGWSVDPFAGLVRDGRVYGRGACDMKGGLAAAIIACAAIRAEGLLEAGALEISATPDEETGGFAGVGWLAERGYFAPGRVDHVIIPEPLNPDRICLGHRGVWWGEVEMRGAIGHGAMPFLGVNAISGMGRLLALIQTELMPALAARQTRMPCEPAGARAATLNLNSIHGGEPEPGEGMPAPVVADSCRLVLDRRYLIEEDFGTMRGEIAALIARAADAPGLSATLRDLMSFPPTMTEPDAPVVQTLGHYVEMLFGRPARHIASPGSYDQKHITRNGGVRSCVAYGPGILDLAHQPDEWVGIADMLASAKIMAASALALTRHAAR